MDYFDEARKLAYEKLCLEETVVVLNKNNLSNEFTSFKEIWEVSIPLESLHEDVLLYICLNRDFPLSLPSIYVAPASYDRIKYIPHIDSDQKVCTFDTDKVRTDPKNPFGIVRACLSKARQIIESGLRKDNLKDFSEEFLSYWNCRYDEQDVNQSILSLIEKDPAEFKVKFFKLNKSLGIYNGILYQETTENRRLKEYLEGHGYKLEEYPIHYLEAFSIADVPSYEMTNREAITRILRLGEKSYEEYKRYLNRSSKRLLVLFPIERNGVQHYLGYFHSLPQINRAGFRPGKLKAIDALYGPQGGEKVQRVSPEDFTEKRLNIRTSGFDIPAQYKFGLAGCGSIGSNLIHFINSLNSPAFRLVDFDVLKVENLGRHLLGTNYLNIHKAEALMSYIKNLNPKQDVEISVTGIIDILQNDPDFINACTAFFVAIGRWNTEKWIADQIQIGNIKVPTFILWVEPYLAGGHCIFINPKSFRHDEFYYYRNNHTMFKWNVIEEAEYLSNNPILVLKEANCQTSYIPYSNSNVVLFLSALFPKIIEIINNETESCSFTWVGDKSVLEKLGLKLSEFGKTAKSYTISKNEV